MSNCKKIDLGRLALDRGMAGGRRERNEERKVKKEDEREASKII